jgi:hypothetical protein
VKRLVPDEKFIAVGMNQSADFFCNEKQRKIFFRLAAFFY